MSPALLDALNHPIRRQVLRILHAASHPKSPRELACALRWGLPQVSYHVRLLSDRKVLRHKRTRSIRGATQSFYVSTVAENELVSVILSTTEAIDARVIK